MVILIVEKVSASLRGELSRWLIQPQTGVFVGRISGRVRDLLWEKVCIQAEAQGGRALLVHRARNEQGFTIRSHGERQRQIVDFEGLTLVKIIQES